MGLVVAPTPFTRLDVVGRVALPDLTVDDHVVIRAHEEMLPRLVANES